MFDADKRTKQFYNICEKHACMQVCMVKLNSDFHHHHYHRSCNNNVNVCDCSGAALKSSTTQLEIICCLRCVQYLKFNKPSDVPWPVSRRMLHHLFKRGAERAWQICCILYAQDDDDDEAHDRWMRRWSRIASRKAFQTKTSASILCRSTHIYHSSSSSSKEHVVERMSPHSEYVFTTVFTEFVCDTRTRIWIIPMPAYEAQSS